MPCAGQEAGPRAHLSRPPHLLPSDLFKMKNRKAEKQWVGGWGARGVVSAGQGQKTSSGQNNALQGGSRCVCVAFGPETGPRGLGAPSQEEGRLEQRWTGGSQSGSGPSHTLAIPQPDPLRLSQDTVPIGRLPLTQHPDLRYLLPPRAAPACLPPPRGLAPPVREPPGTPSSSVQSVPCNCSPGPPGPGS